MENCPITPAVSIFNLIPLNQPPAVIRPEGLTAGDKLQVNPLFKGKSKLPDTGGVQASLGPDVMEGIQTSRWLN
jgi:hypothetical protein